MTYAQSPYPVIEERQLDRAKRRLLLGGRREDGELPKLRPGTVLVVENDGHFEALADRRHLSGRETLLVDAVAVSVIDIRTRLISASYQLGSRSPADEFTITAAFHCKVSHPETVAKAGITDLTPILREYLRQDQVLAGYCAGQSVDNIRTVNTWVAARVSAYCHTRPPHIDGLSVALSDIEVVTPKDLHQHATQLRDESWRQQREDLKASYDYKDAARIKGVSDLGPDALAALAVARKDLNLAEVVAQRHQSEAEQRDALLTMIRMLDEGSHTDTAPIDVMPFLSAFAERTTGRPLDGGLAAAPGASSMTAGNGGRAGLPSADDDEPPAMGEEDLL